MLVKIGYVLIILIPILGQYTIFNLPLSIAEMSIAAYIIIIILNKGIKKNLKLFINKSYIIMVLGMLLSGLIMVIFLGNEVSLIEMLNGFMRIIFYLISIMIIIPYINYNELFKYYCKCSNIIIILFFIQVFFYYALNRKIVLIIPFLNLFVNKDIEVLKMFMFRPSSVFLEPSWMAIYILPVFIYMLFKKNNILMSSIIAIAIVLSTSSLGMISVVILIVCKFIFETKINIKKIVLAISLILSLLMILNTPYVENSIKRLSNIRNSGSTMMRVYRGFNLYEQLPDINKIFGVSVGNLENFIENNDYIDDKYHEEGSKEFVSDILYIFITSGVIGGILYVIFLLDLLINSTLYLKMNILVFIIIGFTSPMLTNYTWLFYMFILFSIKLKENKMRDVRRVV